MVLTVEEEQCVNEKEDFEPESLFFVEERHLQELVVSSCQRAMKPLPPCAFVLDCGKEPTTYSTSG